jgi:hypothetical protein
LDPGFSGQVVFSDRMLAFLQGRPNLGRKRRLLAVACCQRVLAWMPEECLPAVAVAERLAEGPVEEAERWAAYVAAGEAHDLQNDLPRTWAGYCAYRAVEAPSDYEQPTSWDDDAAAWVAHVAAQPVSWVHGRWDDAALVRERRAVAGLIRDLFGNPFRPVAFAPAWRTPGAVGLAQALYDERAFDRLPPLGDELERAGCREPTVLGHCRQPGTHVRGCWVVDSVLAKH